MFLHQKPKREVLPISEKLWIIRQQIKINQAYFLKFAKFLRTTVKGHDTKAKNVGP